MLQKHGIDFRKAIEIFNGNTIVYPSRQSEDEERWIAIGILDQTEIAVIYTTREKVCRVITARRARRYERSEYHARYPGGGP
ncbi:MAG: BrnT family toxin [Proteobacteria bacterium]|nr:BrnT family toxin [Pseudomonadota bacterium]MCH8950743.1 BrnT family toxin [Pseudomonadota bacterium]